MAGAGSAELRAVFVGSYNARDLGGHHTGDGSRIPARRLFRSDFVAALARPRVEASPLTTVIDLRSDEERRQGPSYAVPSIHLPLENPQRGISPDEWTDAARVAARYFDLLMTGSDSVAEILAILTDPAAYPVVIGCSSGKDRTGIVAALLLGLVGVSDDAVVADYAMSGLGCVRILDALCARDGGSAAALRRSGPALLSAQPASMHLLLDRMRAKFGSLEGYVDELEMGSAIPYLRVALSRPACAG